MTSPEGPQKDWEIDFIRASGGCLCEVCGLEYRKHPFDQDILGMEDHQGVRQPYLNVLCDGLRVKL